MPIMRARRSATADKVGGFHFGVMLAHDFGFHALKRGLSCGGVNVSAPLRAHRG
jgi:hypothetical protein